MRELVWGSGKGGDSVGGETYEGEGDDGFEAGHCHGVRVEVREALGWDVAAGSFAAYFLEAQFR